MTPAQAAEIRRAIVEMVRSAVATSQGVQITKPGKVGHAKVCRRELDVMITAATTHPAQRTVNALNVLSAGAIGHNLHIVFTSVRSAEQFLKEIQ